MRRNLFILPALAAAAGMLALAGPASADTTAPTPVTFEVMGGSLDITAPATSPTFSAATASLGSQTVTATLTAVDVTDGRGGVLGWVATATASDFTGDQAAPQTILATDIAYASPVATHTGTVTVTATQPSTLSTSSTVQTATAVSGVNTASWSPTITVTVPASTQTGSYDGTITHDVS